MLCSKLPVSRGDGQKLLKLLWFECEGEPGAWPARATVLISRGRWYFVKLSN